MHETEPAPAATVVRHRRISGGGLLMALAALVAIGGIAFAAGRLTAPAAANATGNRPGGGQLPSVSFAPGASFDPGSPFGARAMSITGTVQSLSGDSLTIKTDAGTTLTVDVSGATYHVQANAAAADVTVGTDVRVQVGGGVSGQAAGASASPGAQTMTASDVTIVAR